LPKKPDNYAPSGQKPTDALYSLDFEKEKPKFQKKESEETIEDSTRE